MVQVIERAERRYEVWEECAEVRDWHSLERVVLECNCRARWILEGQTPVRRGEELDGLECGICGRKFVVTRRASITATL